MPQNATNLFSSVCLGHPSCAGAMGKGVHSMAVRGAERGRTPGKVSRESERADQRRRRKTALKKHGHATGLSHLKAALRQLPAVHATFAKASFKKAKCHNKERKPSHLVEVRQEEEEEEGGTGTDVALPGQRRGSSPGGGSPAGKVGAGVAAAPGTARGDKKKYTYTYTYTHTYTRRERATRTQTHGGGERLQRYAPSSAAAAEPRTARGGGRGGPGREFSGGPCPSGGGGGARPARGGGTGGGGKGWG